MKKLIAVVLSAAMMFSMSANCFAAAPDDLCEGNTESSISEVTAEELFNDENWTILYEGISETPLPANTQGGVSAASSDAMYTKLTVGYNRNDLRLAVGIKNYVPNNTGEYLFSTMTGKIMVTDEESLEVIISGQSFSATNIVPSTTISTNEAIENIGLPKGSLIQVTVSGNCLVNSEIVAFSQTAHCTVSV